MQLSKPKVDGCRTRSDAAVRQQRSQGARSKCSSWIIAHPWDVKLQDHTISAVCACAVYAAVAPGLAWVAAARRLKDTCNREVHYIPACAADNRRRGSACVWFATGDLVPSSVTICMGSRRTCNIARPPFVAYQRETIVRRCVASLHGTMIRTCVGRR